MQRRPGTRRFPMALLAAGAIPRGSDRPHGGRRGSGEQDAAQADDVVGPFLAASPACNDASDVRGAQHIQSGMALLKGSPPPLLDQELGFATNVFNFSVAFPGYRVELKDVIDLLKTRHKSEPIALARIMGLEANVASVTPGGGQRRIAVLEEAIAKAKRARIDAGVVGVAIVERTWRGMSGSILGEGGRGAVAGNFSGSPSRSFPAVLNFPLTDEPYWVPSGQPFQRPLHQRRAANHRTFDRRAVAKAQSPSLCPWVAAEMYPERVKFIDPMPPEAAEFEEQMMLYLQLALKGEPKESASAPPFRRRS